MIKNDSEAVKPENHPPVEVFYELIFYVCSFNFVPHTFNSLCIPAAPQTLTWMIY